VGEWWYLPLMNKRGALFSVVLTALVAGGGVVMSTANAAETVMPGTIAQVGRYSTVESAQTGSAVDASYMLTIRALSKGTNYERVADADMIAMGHTFCESIDAGNPVSNFAKWAELADIPKGVVRSQLAASEAFYCVRNLGYSF